ncbi:MAG: oligosaccharide flippase family protein [Candidatus Aminicenantes bacterium]|nr:oligosaccharide flippase family protein [Candidatus Aminicenantes bacterium]
MFVHLRRLSAQTLIYGLGEVATRLAALLLLPVYTRILTPADYGKLAIVALVTTVVAIILNSGQSSAFFRFYFQNESQNTRRKLTGTVLIFLLVSATAILLPLILFFGPLAAPLFKDVTLLPLIKIALIGTFFDVGSVIPFATFRAEQRAARYAKLSVLRFFINVTLNIIAVVVLRQGVIGVIYANLLTSILFFMVCLGLTLRTMEWTVDLSLLKQLLRFGLPIVPANLAGWALALSDRFFLQRYSGLGQVGIYAVGYSMAGILSMLTGWFNTAYAPYVYSISKQSDAKVVYARVLTYAITLFTLVGLGLALFAREALVLLTRPAYYGAARIVPLIVLAYLFFEVSYLISFGLDLTGKTGYYPFIVGAGAVVNLFLNLALIPPFGMMGAAVATVLSYMLLPIIGYFIVRRLYPVPYEWRRLLKLALVSVGVYLAGVVLKTGKLWIDLGMEIMLVLTWGLALYGWRFFTQSELVTARSTTSKGLHICQVRLRCGVSKVRRVIGRW